GEPTTHTFESDDSPPPMPSSWRPLGSGDPITERKIGSHCAGSAGRSFLLNTTAFDVPPRMKVALSLLCDIGARPAYVWIPVYTTTWRTATLNPIDGRRSRRSGQPQGDAYPASSACLPR